jgi:hypothetical protein
MSSPDHQEKLRQAVEIARGGDRQEARRLVEEVLQDDEENARAWLLLARLTENVDEKRMALTTVLQLNPGNQRAQEMLDQLEAEVAEAEDDPEIMPGITRRVFHRIVAGVGVTVIMLVIIVLVLVISSARERGERARQETAVAAESTRIAAQATEAAEETLAVAQIATETQMAIVSPTPTASPTRAGPTLPPTPTGTPTPEPLPTLAPLADIPGRIVGWSGRDLQNIGFLPIVIYSVPELGGSPRRIGDRVGRNPSIAPNGTTIVYTRYMPLIQGFHLEIMGADGEVSQSFLDIALEHEVFEDSQMPHFSADGSRFVFTGLALDTLTTEIYMMTLGPVADGPPVRRITADQARYTYPALSPDGNRLVAVRDNPQSDNPGPDLVFIDINTGAPSALTSDRYDLVEMAPRWSPDGSLIAYAAAPQGSNRRDIYIIRADAAGGSGLQLIDSEYDDIYPVFSPDQRHLAFASNRAGSHYDIFIYDLQAQELRQLTASPEDDFPGSWID